MFNKLEALQNFTLKKEKIFVEKGKIIYIKEKGKKYGKKDIVIEEQRASEVKKALYDGMPLVKEVREEKE